MATASTNVYCDGSSLTNFNAWAYWVYQQFIAFGWTQTSDTGQGAFPATGSVPSSVGSYFAIFKSADSLSTAFPIYVKIEFWAASNVPYFGITVGTGGTDGAGNMVTPNSAHIYGGGTYSLEGQAADTTNLYPCYASGDAGSMRLCLFLNPSLGYPGYYNPVIVIIGRSRNSSGSTTGDFALLWTACETNKCFQTVYNTTVGGSNTIDSSGYFIAALPYAGASSSMGGSVLASPVFQNIGGLTNPTPDLLLGKIGDFAGGTTAAITVYNTSHTYLAISTTQFNQFVSGFNTSLLMRYE